VAVGIRTFERFLSLELCVNSCFKFPNAVFHFSFGTKVTSFLVLVPIILFPSLGLAQFKWAHQIGDTGSDVVENHTLDSDGNIIATGRFEGTISIGTYQLTSMDLSDIFVYKTTPDGDVLWAKSFAGPNYGGDVGVDVDSDLNIYVAGGFIEKLYFDGDLKLSSIPSNHYWNSFLAKLDKNGDFIWAKGLLGNIAIAEVRVWGNVSVNEHNIVLTGVYDGEINISDQLLPKPIAFNRANCFVAKFDLDGNLVWIKNPPGQANLETRKLRLEDSGDIFLTAAFTGVVEFDGLTVSSGTPTHADLLLVKLNSDGVTQWVKTGIKTSSREDNNFPQSFTIDPDGNIYLTGVLKGDVTFDNIVLHGNNDVDYSVRDAFLVKYDKDGELQYGSLYGSDSKLYFPVDMQYSKGGLYLLGQSTSGFFLSSIDAEQLTGQPTILKGIGFPRCITVSPVDTSIVISGEMTYLETMELELFSHGESDGFVARLGRCNNLNTPGTPQLTGPQEFCTNTKITFEVEPVDFATRYVWEFPPFVNADGNDISDTTEVYLNVTSDGSGTISVYAVGECAQESSKATIQVHAIPRPVKPTIVKSGCDTKLTIQDGANIKWYKDHELIDGTDRLYLDISLPGDYYVTNNNSCGELESNHILMQPFSSANLFVPNVITPNGDGKNDFFEVASETYRAELSVYNRWGTKVFQDKAYDDSWNASNLADGIYYYTLRHPCIDQLFKGTIHVMGSTENR
jgi:gliding motility-associated-like protein